MPRETCAFRPSRATAGAAPGAGTQRQERVAKLIDTTTCIGCKACEVACLEWNDLPFRETVFRQHLPDHAAKRRGTTGT